MDKIIQKYRMQMENSEFEAILETFAKDKVNRITSGSIEAYSRHYWIKSFATYARFIYTAIKSGDITKESKYAQNLESFFEMLTRTPILISRRNYNSICASLSGIGRLCVAIGRGTDFIKFMNKVLDNHLYVSESSLMEHNGLSFDKDKLFTLPDGIDPYKCAHPKEEIISEIICNIAHDMADVTYTPIVAANLWDDSEFIEEQFILGVNPRKAFVYPSKKYPTISSLLQFLYDRNIPYSEAISSLLYNDSVYGESGTFRLVKEDAIFLNKLLDSDILRGSSVSYFANVYVKDLEFLKEVKNDLVQWFTIESNVLYGINISDIQDFIITKRTIPKSIIKSNLIYDLDIPVDVFVKNIKPLYIMNSLSAREFFNKKYSLEEIIAYLK